MTTFALASEVLSHYLFSNSTSNKFAWTFSPVEPTTSILLPQKLFKLSIPGNYQIKHWPPATRSQKHYKYYDKPERKFPSVSPQLHSDNFVYWLWLFNNSTFSFGTYPFDVICPSSQFQSVCSSVHAPLHSASESLASEKNENFAVFFSHETLTRFAASCCANLRTMMVQFVSHLKLKMLTFWFPIRESSPSRWSHERKIGA